MHRTPITLEYASLAFFIVLITSISGCTSSSIRNDEYAASNGFSKLLVDGINFTHVVYTKNHHSQPDWHVYIEGDGIPWISRRQVSPDPTETLPVALRLMEKDPGNTVYLGRPCYNGTATEKGCNPWFWTHGRYSKTVVDSMMEVLTTLIKTNQINTVTLIGHSGGGTIALLMAESMPDVKTVITIAGNLDTNKWAIENGFTPLEGSLNPSERDPLPDSISEFHLIGRDDGVVSPDTIRQYVIRKRNSKFVLLDKCSHVDCWESIWPQMISDLTEGN